MSLLKTPTPAYRGQSTDPDSIETSDWPQWFLSLTRTPTPAYLRAPVSSQRQPDNGPRDTDSR